MNIIIKYVEECNKVLEAVNIPIEISIQKESCIISNSKMLNEMKLTDDLINIENKVIISDQKRLIKIKSKDKRILDEIIIEEEVEQTTTDCRIFSLLKYNSTKFYYEYYHKVNYALSIIYVTYIRT